MVKLSIWLHVIGPLSHSKATLTLAAQNLVTQRSPLWHTNIKHDCAMSSYLTCIIFSYQLCEHLTWTSCAKAITLHQGSTICDDVTLVHACAFSVAQWQAVPTILVAYALRISFALAKSLSRKWHRDISKLIFGNFKISVTVGHIHTHWHKIVLSLTKK